MKNLPQSVARLHNTPRNDSKEQVIRELVSDEFVNSMMLKLHQFSEELERSNKARPEKIMSFLLSEAENCINSCREQQAVSALLLLKGNPGVAS